ncbi:DUF2637 domain-containing protein [Streptomyces sp. B21-083]|uniref:DUF2637 domain-containing protein n=1 Tax=Streptomyces sp. B21-083 TaxID=3039410 RepID=UPI002FF09379
MNREHADLSFTRREWYSDAYPFGSGTGRNGSPVDALHPGTLYNPNADKEWDPVEELAQILQDAVPTERTTVVSPPHREPPSGVDFTDRVGNLEQITAELPAIRRSSAGHRKIPGRKRRFTWLRTGSFVIAAFVAVIVAMVSVFGGMAAYEPLQHVPAGAKGVRLIWWPFLVYGPWIVSSLSILRTALHQRRALHSWLLVLTFSSVAIMLCVSQAEKSFTGIAEAALPAVASLACFQQLVRQITLTLPPRQNVSRHRH